MTREEIEKVPIVVAMGEYDLPKKGWTGYYPNEDGERLEKKVDTLQERINQLEDALISMGWVIVFMTAGIIVWLGYTLS